MEGMPLETHSSRYVCSKQLSTHPDEQRHVEQKESSLLVIILDTTSAQDYIRADPHNITHCLDSICAFANAHLMQRSINKLAVLACHHHGT